jgi:hypothetical protein
MRACGLHTPAKLLALSTLLAISLSALLWGVMQQAASGRFVLIAANEGAANEVVRFVNQQENALANQEIRLLCFEGELDTTPTDIQFMTSGNGTMPVALPAGCTHVAALHLWHVQPSGKPGHGPAYWVYTTSWAPGSSDLTAITANGQTTVTIPNSRTLVLFNVVVGLAWEPPESSQYVSNLLKGLGEKSVLNDEPSASSYLYDLTNGTMAIGPVAIHTGGEAWESTDIRVVPANDLKPSAQVGGIVTHSFHFTSTVFPTATTVYSPGAITLGRNWAACAADSGTSPHPSGYLITCTPVENVTDTVKLYGATDAIVLPPFVLKYGNWDDAPGFRTIVHEWAHYALFLYDEYQTVQALPTECTRAENKLIAQDKENASAMDWHYTASEFWEEMPPPPGCIETKQYAFHGLSDCETLAAWFEIQQIANAQDLPPLGCSVGAGGAGPDSLGLVKFLFGREPPTTIIPTPRHWRYLPYLRSALIRDGTDRAGAPASQAKPAAAGATTIDALVEVDAFVPGREIESIPTTVQAYQLRPNAAQAVDQIWYQGKVISDFVIESFNGTEWDGHITVLGAQSDVDQVKVFGQSYTTDLNRSVGGRWFGEAPIGSNTVVKLTPIDWPASLDLAYEVSTQGQVVSVTAHVSLPVVGGGIPPSPQIEAVVQLCGPDRTIRCYWEEKLTPVSATATHEYWRASIIPAIGDPTLPNYGIVRLHVSYFTPGVPVLERELISWYKTSGVGPGSYNANAPTPPGEDDVVTLFSESVRRHCNQLIFSTATNAEMLSRPLGSDDNGNPIMGLLGQPVDIAVRLPLEEDGDVCPQQFGQGSRTVAQKDIYLTLSYNHLYQLLAQEIMVDYLAPAVESNLHILFFDPDTGWEVVAPLATTRNTTMNWISVPFEQDGIYAIGWVKP